MAELTATQEAQLAAYVQEMYAVWLPRVEAAVLGAYNRFGVAPDPTAANATVRLWNAEIQQMINSQLTVIAAENYTSEDPEGTFSAADALAVTAAAATLAFLLAQIGDIQGQLYVLLATATNFAQAAELVRDFLNPSSAHWAAKAAQVAATEGDRWAQVGTLLGAIAAQRRDETPRDKIWETRNDTRVRDAHRTTRGQRRGLREMFDVAGFPMLYPKDPSAPPGLVVGCRCWMRIVKREVSRG